MINVSANCSVRQNLLPFVEAKLCRWAGLCLTDEVECFIHNNSVVGQIIISLQFCVYWMIVYNETRT